MKRILNLFFLFLCCLLCLFPNSSTDPEVYGTYNLIDGFKYNSIFSTPTTEPPVQTELTVTTKGPTAKSLDNEESPKQVSAPLIETATVSPISAPQIFNRFTQTPNNYNNYNPAMARKIGLSTLMMSGVLYGLSVLPALIAITGASPLAGLFSSLGRRKRSLVNESYVYRQLPLLTNEETIKFLKLFESTLASRKIESPGCKKYYTCKVYYSVVKSGEKPKLSVFENAIINVFGIAVERKDFKIQFIPTVKMYYNVAKDSIKGESCARRYPCPLHATQYHIKPGL